jgi:Argininosuccinate lyase
VVGKLVLYCGQRGKTLESLSLDEYRALHPLFEEDVYHAISLDTCLGDRRSFGGPAKESVLAQIESAEAFLRERSAL